MMIRRKKKKKAKGGAGVKLIIAAGVLVLAIAAVLYFLLYNGREETTEAGAMVFTLNDKSAVVIRDETAYIASEHTKTDFKKEEGDQVTTGESLALIYKLGYSDELMQSLLNAREEVYAAQMERIGSTKDSRLDELNAAIESIKGSIEACVMLRSGEDLEALYRRLDSALGQRIDYLRGKVQETETLRRLYSDVADKEELISTWTEEIIAMDDGVVSYYFDGYEQAMNAEKMNMLSADLINRAVKGKGAANWTTDDKTRVCRVVNPNRWYIAFVTKGESMTRLASGVEYEVSVKGCGSYKGVAMEPFVSGKEIVNVIEFDEPIGELIDVRSVSIDVTATVSGVKVKTGAISFEDHEPYIELILTNTHRSIQVDVLASEDGYAIIRPHDSSEVLIEGVKYWNRKH